MASRNSITSITELQRTGQGQTAVTPLRYEWDPGSHTAPLADIDLQLQVRTVREEHAGTTRPVEQVLSATWQPFTIRGEWRDAWAGNGFAKETFRSFAAFVQRAPLVRIEIDDPEILSFDGLITSYSPTYRDGQQIGYEITFSPHVLNGGQNAASASPLPPRTRTRTAALDDIAASVAVIAASTAALVDVQTASALTDTIATGAAETSSLIETVRGEVQAAATAVDRARAEIAGYTAIQNSAYAMLDDIANTRASAEAAVLDGESLVRIDLWLRDVSRYSRQIVLEAYNGQVASRARAAIEDTKRYRPIAGESVYTIARKFYGDPTGWQRIAEANNLTTLRFDGSEELIIPEVSA